MIGFIGSGEQAKMHLLAMKTVCPTLTEGRVSAKTAEEEQQFVRELAPLVPDMELVAAGTDGARAMEGPTSWSPPPAPRRRCSRPPG